MSCYVNDLTPNSPEYNKFYKPQNHQSCGSDNTCESPSVAPKDSPLWKWEQIYGKLVTTVRLEQDQWGRTVQIVEKTPCPLEPEKKHTHGCCSFRYKVQR